MNFHGSTFMSEITSGFMQSVMLDTYFAPYAIFTILLWRRTKEKLIQFALIMQRETRRRELVIASRLLLFRTLETNKLDIKQFQQFAHTMSFCLIFQR